MVKSVIFCYSLHLYLLSKINWPMSQVTTTTVRPLMMKIFYWLVIFLACNKHIRLHDLHLVTSLMSEPPCAHGWQLKLYRVLCEMVQKFPRVWYIGIL